MGAGYGTSEPLATLTGWLEDVAAQQTSRAASAPSRLRARFFTDGVHYHDEEGDGYGPFAVVGFHIPETSHRGLVRRDRGRHLRPAPGLPDLLPGA